MQFWIQFQETAFAYEQSCGPVQWLWWSHLRLLGKINLLFSLSSIYGYGSMAVRAPSWTQVRFDDIAELQSRNAQLLQIVRKLSEEQEKWASSTSMAMVQTSSGTPTRRGFVHATTNNEESKKKNNIYLWMNTTT